MADLREAQLYAGQILNGRFRVRDLLAVGGFGLVFEGDDLSNGSSVALKILQQNPPADDQLEFQSEGEFLALLRNASNVLTLIHAGQDEITVLVQATNVAVPLRVHYMALELADACLAELLVRRTEIDWPTRLRLYRGVAKGVHQMHLQRMVHRDLKSENVLVISPTRSQPEAVVADLGRSRLTTQPARFRGDDYLGGRGDFRFAPPELLWLQGHDSPTCWRRIDLYLLGSLFFEVVTGQGITTLMLGDGLALVRRVATLPPTARAEEFRALIPELRARLDGPIVLLANELPKSIRHEGVRLVKQLCDPEPSVRDPRPRTRTGSGWGLEWVLRRVDILQLQMSTAQHSRAGRRVRSR
jgi:serine/threonine protein kinase